MKQEYAKFNGKILKVKANICGFIHFENGEKATERDIIFCTKEGIDLEYGARPLKRAIQTHLENELSELILQRAIKPGDDVVASAKDDKMVFRVK